MFTEFKLAVQRKFNEMKKHDLFRVDLDKDKLWDLYLSSFPIGTNPMFKERTEHDCQCCKSFVRAVGNMVAIIDGKVVSLWDANVGGFYQVVADAMAAFVKTHQIENIFLHTERTAGIDKNFQFQTPTGEVSTFSHFFIQLPTELISSKTNIGTELSNVRSTKDVMLRSLKEISTDSVETVLELIGQNSLYRGEEHRSTLTGFLKLKKEFDKLPVGQQDIFVWENLKRTPFCLSKIRGTVIIEDESSIQATQALGRRHKRASLLLKNRC